MAAKSLKIDSLELDLENPRITLATDQRDARQSSANHTRAPFLRRAANMVSARDMPRQPGSGTSSWAGTPSLAARATVSQ